MTPKEFARLTGVSAAQVSVMLSEGRLPVRAVRIGRLWRIPRADYEAWKSGRDQ
ncbi:MAG: helix-turn-helix domain-containing protein [Planctomycetaceae bacterium]|nr:helix-turn-helix domain-containing protein [Planctomycetaceae bacterium]